LNNDAFEKAKETAAARCMEVEDYVSGLVIQDSEGEIDDSFFTPEILAEIDAAYEEAKTGKSLTLEEFDAQLREHKKACLEKRQS